MQWFLIALLILADTYVISNKKIKDEMEVGYMLVSSIIGLLLLF